MTILCYHTVEPNWRSPLAIEPAVFDRHCAWLSRRGVVPLVEATPGAGNGRRAAAIALTFDDGLSGVYEHAFAALVRHRLPATVFVVADTLVPPGKTVDWVDTPPAFPLRTITLEQVLEMQDAGIAFGSHSASHADLTTLGAAEVEADLRRSRELLEDLLRRAVPTLAYPRGRHNETVRRAAQRAGFTFGYTLPEGPEPFEAFAIPRVGIYPGNGPASLLVKSQPWYLSIRTSSAYPWIRRVVRGGAPPRRAPG